MKVNSMPHWVWTCCMYFYLFLIYFQHYATIYLISRKWIWSAFIFLISVLAVAVSVCWLACRSDRQWSSWELEKNNLWSDVKEQTRKHRDLPRCLARWGFTPRGLVVFEEEGRTKRWILLSKSRLWRKLENKTFSTYFRISTLSMVFSVTYSICKGPKLDA